MNLNSFSIIRPKLSNKKRNILGLLIGLFLVPINAYLGTEIIKIFVVEIGNKYITVAFLVVYTVTTVCLVFYLNKKYVLAYVKIGTVICKEEGIEIVQGEFRRALRYLDIRKMILRNSLGYKRGLENSISYSCEIELITKEQLKLEILRDGVIQPESFRKRRNKIFNLLDEKMPRYKVY
ncbi:hypothetical protein [Saccharicrinis aurantiacus]|uniref:hypothetical protein n=1 Tax=Saccharicrinis aurantiacus TaxID=1849719 RepID=UPI00094F7C1B|nr:hypothetical protein [Saccharicrinis aurantiacus]